MRMVKLAALAAGASLLVGSAQAATFVLSFSGTVKSGTDGAGLFGAAGADLAGLAFTSSYVFDDANRQSGLDGSVSGIGGTFFGVPSPLISAEITINGMSHAAVGGFNDQYYEQNAVGIFNGFYYRRIVAQTFVEPVWDLISNTCGQYRVPQLTDTCSNDGASGGGFSFAGQSTNGVLITTWAESSNPLPLGVSYAPEPATWAMMIAGFGMVGGTLRRRREMAA